MIRDILLSHSLLKRKGRGDELKSFDEMERMTSELEDMNAPHNQEDDDKSTGEALGEFLPSKVLLRSNLFHNSKKWHPGSGTIHSIDRKSVV